MDATDPSEASFHASGRRARWRRGVLAISLALIVGLALLGGGLRLLPPASSPTGQGPLQSVADFALLDQDGHYHQLRRYAGSRAVVVFVHGVGCPIVRQSLPALQALKARYTVVENDFMKDTRRQVPEPGLGLLARVKRRFGYEADQFLTRRWLDESRERQVSFLMINANPQDDREALRNDAKVLGIDLPILKDDTQLVVGGLGINRTALALLIDTRNWKIVYRGPIDDRLDFGTAKPAATREPLKDAIEALLDGGTPTPSASFDAPGCAISPLDKVNLPVSYARDVAPLLLAKCVTCHRAGGIGPWAMDRFETVRGWSAMVREVVSTRRMPPWDADPEIGHFANDRSLSAEQIRMLVDWVDVGAPRGDGPDPLLARVVTEGDEWPLGKPDLVIEAPTQDIPAQGVLDYRYANVPWPLDKDVWVRAVHLLPGDAAVVHHQFAFLKFPPTLRASEPDVKMGINGFFAAFAPGLPAEPFPAGSGQFVPKGSVIQFQQHYTPVGRATRDRTRLAIYLHRTPPASELRVSSAHNLRFRIPALVPEHPAQARFRLDQDITLHALFPHMHLRGASARYVARSPDGSELPLLSVPRYRFGWQGLYVLQQPLALPAGTEIVLQATFDNSTLNPANPDPGRAVYWGEQTTDEMLIGYLLYTVPRTRTEADAAHEKHVGR